MTTDANKVVAGKPKVGGAIYSGPLNTTLPTDAVTALDAALKNLGYVSDDGLENEVKTDTDDIKAWGGDTVMTAQKGTSDTFKYTLIEAINIDVLKEVYGADNVTGDLTTGIKINVNSKEKPVHALVVDMIVREHPKRIVIPMAKIKEIGPIKYGDADPVGYEINLQAFPDDKGNTHYEYIGGTA